MSIFKLFSFLYDFFLIRRPILYISAIFIILTSVAMFSNIRIYEDIQSMLPDNQSDAAVDFKLLQQAPFARKLFVSLEGKQGATSRYLIETADRLAKRMESPFFSKVVTGPGPEMEKGLFLWLTRSLPNLVTDQDMEKILQNLTAEKVQLRLQDIYTSLLTPEGLAFKALFRIDPLGFNSIVFKKLSSVNLIPKIRLEDGHFISADGKNVLIIADTDIKITDSKRSKEMLDYFRSAVDAVVPSNIKVSFISGHCYAAANAGTIRKDILVILSFSSFAILVLFLIFLRNWRAIFVLIVPFSVLFIASAGVFLVYKKISAITIGFGSVLLGISVDFALHIYFALHGGKEDPSTIIRQISRPMLLGGATTIGAFFAMLFSDLPGQRQMAVFSIIGISASLIISLVVLPHLVGAGYEKKESAKRQPNASLTVSSGLVVSAWLLLMVLSIWQGTRLSFDDDLRSLSFVPSKIRIAENEMRQTWGNFRGTAMIFTKGPDLQSALENNDRLFAYLSKKISPDSLISLSPIFPSLKLQRLNQQRWTAFWENGKKELLRKLLDKEGKRTGFTADAFLFFLNSLSGKFVPVVYEDLNEAGLGDLLDSMIIRSDDSVQILTFLPDTFETVDILSGKDAKLKGVRLISQTNFSRIISNAVTHDFLWFIIRASILVFFLLGIFFRNIKKIFFALIPVATGLIFMFGMMGCVGIKFNMFNIAAAILVIGLGVDYGIFMVCRISKGYDHDTGRAVLVSGLTTLAGFGSLILAKHPAIHSIGITVLLGICAAIPAALLVVPALYRSNRKTSDP